MHREELISECAWNGLQRPQHLAFARADPVETIPTFCHVVVLRPSSKKNTSHHNPSSVVLVRKDRSADSPHRFPETIRGPLSRLVTAAPCRSAHYRHTCTTCPARRHYLAYLRRCNMKQIAVRSLSVIYTAPLK